MSVDTSIFFPLQLLLTCAGISRLASQTYNVCALHALYVSPMGEYQSGQVVLPCGNRRALLSLRISNILPSLGFWKDFPQYRVQLKCSHSYSTSAPAFKHTEREERFPINALSKSLPQLQHPEWPEYLFGCLFYGRTNMSVKKREREREIVSSLYLSLNAICISCFQNLSLSLSLTGYLSAGDSALSHLRVLRGKYAVKNNKQGHGETEKTETGKKDRGNGLLV